MILAVAIFLVALRLEVTYALPNTRVMLYKEEWNSWKEEHNMKYPTWNEEIKRYSIWEENKKFIEEHNSKNLSFVLRMNQFGDLTLDEYSLTSTCHLISETQTDTDFNAVMYDPPKDAELPQAIDWRKRKAVTGVKNQGEYRCHSCYAFAAVGALESHKAIYNGSRVRLSEQNVIDCSVGYGNSGCKGGNYRMAYDYIIKNKGIDTQSYYPYKALKKSCKYNSQKVGATMTKVAHIESRSESALKSAVGLKGPVVVSIDHRHQSFQFYGGGVYSESECYTNYYLLTHEMIIVGYGTTYQNQDYWIVKNSYGNSWGKWGYMLMVRGQNTCGVATDAAFPIIN